MKHKEKGYICWKFGAHTCVLRGVGSPELLAKLTILLSLEHSSEIHCRGHTTSLWALYTVVYTGQHDPTAVQTALE